MDWTALAQQIPLVAAFIWFSVEMQKRYMESMDKRDARYIEAINKVTEALEELRDCVK
jgi:hypothetical protein